MNADEKAVKSYLEANAGPQHYESIAVECRLSNSETLSALTLLQLRGFVTQHTGKRFSIKAS